MRVALFSWESLHSILLGGLGVHVTELAAGLERRGHEVHVITRRGPRQPDYDQIDGVHYHRVDHALDENFVVMMDLMCKAMVHRFHEVTSLVGGFDLVHAHDWLTANTLSYVRDGWGTPGILTMHSTEYGRDGNVFHDGMARWVRDTEAAGCRQARLVIAVSSFLASELQRIYGVPHDRIHVVPNGVAYHQFDGFIDPGPVKGRYAIGPLDPTLFASGRMMAQKGMDLLVEAVPMVLASYPSAKFVIAGEGPEKAAVVARAHEVGAAGAIRFLGALPRREYVDLVKACDIVVVPSRNEPFGIVVLEAWAAGKPVVATTAGGPREFVWHDVNGFLVDANPGGLAHGIGSLLADHDHCRALGRNGRIAVEDRFNWDNVARYTEGVYQAALS
ncbi:MAG TPA: glycosyltransferase family 4 protein [Polyangiaceae bacterium]|nr:glycosyltransferase family 4 protein [Polyangiaceae bacterium]